MLESLLGLWFVLGGLAIILGLGTFVINTFCLMNPSATYTEREGYLEWATVGIKFFVAGLFAPVVVPVGLVYLVYRYFKEAKEVREARI